MMDGVHAFPEVRAFMFITRQDDLDAEPAGYFNESTFWQDCRLREVGTIQALHDRKV